MSVAQALQALGTPIPDVPHAVSVRLPTWAAVVGYEEGDPAVVGALRAGYPRFVFHDAVKALMADAEAALGDRVLVLPSAPAAERGRAFLARHGVAATIHPHRGVVALRLPEAGWPLARQVWQHGGEIVSSRRAEAALAGQGDVDAGARDALRARVAGLVGVPGPEVAVHPSGMAAIAHALRLAQALHPGRRTAQVGFPYLDALKLQERLGAGCLFLPHADATDLAALALALAEGSLAAVFLEVPGNPLMRTPDLARIAALTRQAGVPLVVDDSLGAFFNHDLRPYADVLVASLTKGFSGNGDALGGALVLNPASPLHGALKAAWAPEPETLFGADAAALLRGAADFEARSARVNATTAALAAWLATHPAVARVYHPATETPEAYRQALRPAGGEGGMLSLVLHDPAAATPAFFDRLAVAKGPSFGIRETLVCPYAQLAHFHELGWAEACGVSRWLIRVSVGLEPLDAVRDAFGAALAGEEAS